MYFTTPLNSASISLILPDLYVLYLKSILDASDNIVKAASRDVEDDDSKNNVALITLRLLKKSELKEIRPLTHGQLR